MISDQPYLPTSDSAVVISTYSGLRAITEDGEIEWSEDIRPAGDLLGTSDTIFTPTQNGVEARSYAGRQKWVWETESPVYSLGHENGSVYAKSGTSLYSIREGEVEWEYQTTIEPSTPLVARDGLVFIGTENSRIVAIRTDDPSIEWEQTLENSVAAPITVGQHVYAAGWSYPLKAYNPANGEGDWTFDPSYQTLSAAVEKNGVVYVGNNDYLFARDAGNGKPLWSYSVNSSIWAPPAVDGDRVYATTENGGVLCLTE
jgi:outer membrane protein assembly factor BamB